MIYSLPRELKNLVVPFIIVLSIGYFVSILLVDHTSSLSNGIEENYLGNESQETQAIYKFKKSKYQIYNLIHSHIISMSIIFFITGYLLITDLNYYFKMFLIIEPFVSILMTLVESIYFEWGNMDEM